MSLSEIIAGIEQGESIAFTRVGSDLQLMAVKYDDEFNRKEVARRVDAELLKLCRIDSLAADVRRAFEILRRSKTADAN
jgi:hypothetical protein